MKTIKFKISLEDFKTRTPNTIPSIAYRMPLNGVLEVLDSGRENMGVVYDYDYTTITTARDNAELMLNYGMFPSDIDIPRNICLPIIGDICDEDCSIVTHCTDNRTIPYSSLKRIYFFMVDYFKKLTVEMPCGTKVYSSVKEYNLHESDQLDEGLDETFRIYGGQCMFDWLVDNIFLRFYILEEYQEEWNKDFLSLGEFAQWYSWFQSHYKKYSGTTDCSQEEDCCDCSKYIALGGNTMYEAMKEWLENTVSANQYVSPTISYINGDTEMIVSGASYSGVIDTSEEFEIEGGTFYNIEKSEYETPTKECSVECSVQVFNSFIELPILIETTIDDMGEMSIFCNEWVGYHDYSVKAEGYEDFIPLKPISGTVVTYNDRDWILTSDKYSGYFYSDYFKECYFGSISGMTEEEKEYATDKNNQLYEGGVDGATSSTRTHQWARYIDMYYGEHASEFNPNTNETFAYKDFKLVVNPTPIAMSDKYEVTRSDTGFIVANNVLIEIVKSDFIVYKRNTSCFDKSRYNKSRKWDYNDTICLVDYVDELNKLNPYIIINDRQYYGVWIKRSETDKTQNTWNFNFSTINGEGACQASQIIQNGLFAIIEGVPFLVSDGKVDFYGTIYDVFKEYVRINNTIHPINNQNEICDYFFDDEKGEYVLIGNNEIFGTKYEINDTAVDNATKGYCYNNGIINAYVPYMVYKSDYISGETESRLSLFRDKMLSCDDLGHELPGNFSITSKGTIVQPSEGSFLELPYTIGRVTNIEELYTDKENETSYYWGDILTKIELFYQDNLGRKVMSCWADVNDSTFGYDGKINSVKYKINFENYFGNKEKKEEKADNVSFYHMVTVIKDKLIDYLEDNDKDIVKIHNGIDDTLYCSFTYYNGAKISREYTTIDQSEESVYLYGTYKCADKVDDGKINGVKYTEIDTITTNQCDYYIDDTTSYVLNYFNLHHRLKTVDMCDYSGVKIVAKMTYFETNISAFKKSVNVKNEDFFVNDNGFICLPNIREAYKFGISSLEKVESDIYINRGNIQAIDKHVKLMEVDSFDDLVNYGNGYFNIIDN